jgi:NADP-dependent 3-hydroxy acid dehydrogenase YdfG
LITGCSTGIGRATAERLAARGKHTVYATARRTESIADLEAKGCCMLALDVTDEASMHGAVEHVIAEHGVVDVLVNNAGYWVLDARDDGGCEILTEETQRGAVVWLVRPALAPAMLRFHQRWVDALATIAPTRGPA